ncbi:uncharacterized protein [Triticum aestivum]|nr:uncharacterized protein LOC123111160 isoform X3 [Triticum aestivum]
MQEGRCFIMLTTIDLKSSSGALEHARYHALFRIFGSWRHIQVLSLYAHFLSWSNLGYYLSILVSCGRMSNLGAAMWKDVQLRRSQGLVPTSLNSSICTVKVLALQFACTDLNAVLDVLRFFPCLEILYVMWNKYLKAEMNNVRHCDPITPIKCLETHLKKLVLKNYTGDEQDVSFAKFFVLNAKVLHEIKFGVSEKFDKKWVADHHRLLGVESEASPEFEFKHCSYCLDLYLDPHDLSIADPFNNSFLAEDHTLPVISISCPSSSDEDSN